jgi:hypothetical protein
MFSRALHAAVFVEGIGGDSSEILGAGDFDQAAQEFVPRPLCWTSSVISGYFGV